MGKKRKRHRSYHDPDPGKRKHKEPSGLRRWRLAQRRTHDPGRRTTRHASHRRRKDSYAPPRHRGPSGSSRGTLGFLNRWASALGALVAGITGVAIGYNDYQQAYGPEAGKNYWNTIVGGEIKDKTGAVLGKRTPEISKLWGSKDFLWAGDGATIPNYLKYKLLGLAQDNKWKGSAWVYTFWGGIAAYLARPIAHIFTHKGDKYLKPIQSFGKGLAGMSTVGALALPGCETSVKNAQALPPPPSNQNQMKIGGAF